MRGFWMAALAAAALLWVGRAGAVEGTFMLADGSHSMTIEEEGANLAVVEPFKRSVFVHDGSGAYVFRDANTGAAFYLRVHDESTIEAGPVGADTPWILKKVDAATAMAALDAYRTYAALAERYAGLAEWDPDNAQVWSVCSAVVFRRSKGEDAGFAAYARQAAQSLQAILGFPEENPCEDAIPARYW